ncbi:MAG: 2-oxo-4-hydroxy-4-carboxy-5-ureidoimidazoline decarboxylase [Aeoliella sp.]
MFLARHLNSLETDDCREQLRRCCAAEAWIDGIMLQRPFEDNRAVNDAAEQVWQSLPEAAWRKAFAAHPQIGDIDTLKEKFGDTRSWAEGEQAEAAEAGMATLHRLAALNQEYLAKFGYIFIVCATGKTAEEMLAILESRLPNSADEEIRLAAAEQLKITQLRLAKLVL